MCKICDREIPENENFRDDEELWRILPDLEGKERADALSQLAIGTCKDFAGKTSIILAEAANKIYRDLGIPDDSSDFVYTYDAIAENLAYVDDYKGAVDAGLKSLPLIEKHNLNETYEQLKWNLFEWMIKAGMYHDVRVYLERVIAAEYEQKLWES